MRRVLGCLSFALMACAAQEPKRDRACSEAANLRDDAREAASSGHLTRALGEIEEANTRCAATRRQSWDVEVGLLADLARCKDAEDLAGEIDTAAWRGDGAWLAAAVARGVCKDAASTDASALYDEATRQFESGERAVALRGFERAMARAGEQPRADFIRWSHKEPGPMAWIGRDAVLVVDQDRASIFSTRDWRELMMLDGHGAIRFVSVSPNGDVVATADADEIKIWEVGARRLRATVHGHGPLALSDDTLAFVRNGAVVTMGVDDGRRRGSLEVDTPAAMARTARGFAVVGRHKLVFFDEDARARRSLEVPYTGASHVLPRPDGSVLVARDDVRNAEIGVDRVSEGGAVEHLGDPVELVLGGSPDGQWLVRERDVNGSMHGQLVRLDQRAGVDLGAYTANAIVSPDGDLVVFRDNAGLHRFEVRTRADHIVIPTATAPVDDLRVVASGDAIAVRGLGRGRGQLWTSAGPTRVPALDMANWSVGEELIVALHTSTFDVLDAHTGVTLRHGATPGQAFVAQDGARVLFASSNQHLFVDPLREDRDVSVAANGESDLGFDPADSSLVVARSGSVFEWRAVPSLDLVRRLDVPGGDANDVSFLRGSGAPAVVITRGGRQQVVSLSKGRVVFDAAVVRGAVLARRPDGTFVRVGRSQGERGRAPLYLFDGEGKAGAGLAMYPHECESFDTSADGRYVAAACKEGSVVIWSTATQKMTLLLRSFPDFSSGYALEPATGHVEIFGEPPLAPVCRAGARSLPFEACADVVEPGLVARVLSE